MALALVMCALPAFGDVVSGSSSAPGPQAAYAETADELEQQVKQSAAAYNGAVARQQKLAAEIDSLNGKISAIEKKLPAQKARSDKSYRALYKYQADTGSVVMMLLGSESFTDMLATLDQYNWVISYNVSEIKKAQDMESDLKSTRDRVAADKADADKATSEAAANLQQAQQARKRAQEQAIAAQKAEEAAAEQQAAQEAQQKAASQGKSKAATKAAVKKAKAKVTRESSDASASHVNLSSPRSKFISKWSKRINAYLAGSPQAGTGKYYAAAAWDNGVDPRWAPAISYIESGLGNKCFASHNAWGYGGRGFSSWKEGIEAVVGTLGSSLYGGKLTRAAARTYCPPNSSHWYSVVSAQMARI